MACTSGCPTGDHETYGECLRAKAFRVAYCGVGGLDASKQKAWDADLALYASARRQGVQPAGTSRVATERALKMSDEAGMAWQA